MAATAATLENFLLEAVRQAVREEVAPLRAELARLRAEREAEGVSLEEAAERLHVSVRTVQRRIKDGSLQAVPGMRPPRVILAITRDAA